jgi:replicative DNA helicase
VPKAEAFPHSLDAERSVLGCLMVEPVRLADVEDQLTAEEFYRDAHQRIYSAMQRLGGRGVRFDFVTLKDELAQAGDIDRVGGAAYLSSLADGVPRGVNLTHYAATVRDKALRRKILAAAAEMSVAARDAETGDEALEQAERAVYDVGARTSTSASLIAMPELLAATRDALDAAHASGNAVTGVATGLADLDERTRGMQRGQLIIAAARPGMGKSAFAVNVTRHVARNDAALFFSLEMSKEEIGTRLVVADAQVDGHQLQRGRLPDADWTRVSWAMDNLHGGRLLIDDTPNRTVTQIRSIARRAQHILGGALRLVVVDYLNLVGSDKRRKGEEKRMPFRGRPQLARAVEERSNERRAARPRLSDLAESGAIERDADQVWFLHRPEADEATAEVIIAKNRSGPKGIVTVAYFEEQFRFANLAAGESR